MARTRKITADDIPDAAARVVTRDGAANLSIDAVAREAGVSKSRVVYDHKHKSGLLEAVIARHVAGDLERVHEAVEANADTAHPQLFGRIGLLESVVYRDADHAIAVAMAIAASMKGEEGIQQQLRDWTKGELDAIASGPRPRAALMTYLALPGLYYTEVFDFHRWSESEREQIFSELRELYTAFPDKT